MGECSLSFNKSLPMHNVFSTHWRLAHMEMQMVCFPSNANRILLRYTNTNLVVWISIAREKSTDSKTELFNRENTKDEEENHHGNNVLICIWDRIRSYVVIYFIDRWNVNKEGGWVVWRGRFDMPAMVCGMRKCHFEI